MKQGREGCEDKIVDREHELKVIGDNMKAMEVSEEKAHQREDILKDQIRHLVSRLKDAESRAEYGEMNVQRIHLQIDQLEDELIVSWMPQASIPRKEGWKSLRATETLIADG